MRALLLLSGLILASGCDDPEVADRIASVLERGAAQAEVVCSGDLTPATSCSPQTYTFKADLLQDGSSLLKFSNRFTNATQFNVRGDALTVCGQGSGSTAFACASVSGGDLVVTSPGLDSCGLAYPLVVDLGTCTGFNLEAFE